MASCLPLAPLCFLLLVLPIAKSELSFTAELIHRDSPLSPYHNASLSPLDSSREAAHRSIDRSRRIGLESFSTPIAPMRFEYLMSLSMGTPPFDILAIADTGSDLIWVQCEPCDNCYEQTPPKFNPAASSSYDNLSCQSDTCNHADRSSCTDIGDLCQYQVQYGDKSYSIGLLATETFTFPSGDSRNVSIPNLAIGCTHESKGTFGAAGSGLVGLGRGPLSLISQLSGSIDGKFSYCLVPYSTNRSSLITFGSTVSDHGVSATPMVPRNPDTFYFLSLESVSVLDGRRITVKGSDEGNIIIDSGTTLTFLPRDVLDVLYKDLIKEVKLPKVSDPSGTFELCYAVNGTLEAGDIPDIVFSFRGAELRLPSANTFVPLKEEVLCLAMLDNGDLGGLSILGNVAQQDFQVGYDLVRKEVSFKRDPGCSSVAMSVG